MDNERPNHPFARIAISQRDEIVEDERAPPDAITRPGEEIVVPAQSGRVPVGRTVGHFVLDRKLGEGGMGLVFAAHDEKLRRAVAIKLLRPDGHGTDGASAQQRMLREAQAMAMLSHPNLVAIFEVGTHDDDVFLAMEYVVGETLEEWLRQDRGLDEVFRIFEQAGYALQAVHDAGLVHRDFKPANVMVTKDGTAKLLDLGIARRAGSAPSAEEDAWVNQRHARDSAPLNRKVTIDGELIGTPAYMAPEQLAGFVAGPAADQFAFSVSLYQALAKRSAFPGATPVEIMSNIGAGEHRPWPVDSEVPKALQLAISRGFAHRPEDRFGSMRELVEACRRALGLRGQIRVLTERWIASGRSHDELLRGALLVEGETLLAQRPQALTRDQAELIRASSEDAKRQRTRRRWLMSALALSALVLGLVSLLLQRRSAELERVTQARVRENIEQLRADVRHLFHEAMEDSLRMFEQRRAWLPAFDALGGGREANAADTREQRMVENATRLNDFFRPLIARAPAISSLRVAREDGLEYLAFDDPDARKLDPPYQFYNRLIDTRAFAGAAFQLFWGPDYEAPQRRGWLREGQADSRGQPWSGYEPKLRPWFKKGIESPPHTVAWTRPYLFFVTKDAGVTGSIGFSHGGQRHVLGVDFMLTDLSHATTHIDDARFVAFLTTHGAIVGLPNDPRFATREQVRAFFSKFDADRRQRLRNEKRADADAELPTAKDLNIDFISAATDARARLGDGDRVYSFPFKGQTLWAGSSRVGAAALGLVAFVVERPRDR